LRTIPTEQVDIFLGILNDDDDFEASLVNVSVFMFSSGDTVRIEKHDGFYEFNGWCFNAI
jgi:hypothetical protein